MTTTSPPVPDPGPWSPDALGDLGGLTAVVTGATSGLGLEVTRQLARLGATVVMAVRDPAKGDRVRGQLLDTAPRGRLEVRALDLADLDSVRRFADQLVADGRPVDVLLNNAGISNQPRRTTPQGHEAQLATNFLGHFALTGRVLGLLERSPGARVVSVGSVAHRLLRTRLDLDDLMGERSYSPGGAYVRSKLASTLFGQELERRLRASGSRVRSLVAHPGMATTPGHASVNSVAERALVAALGALLARPVEQGALPLLYAAAAPEAPTGVFIGPTGPRRAARISLAAHTGQAADPAVAARLWGAAEELTAVRYPGRRAARPPNGPLSSAQQ